MSHVNWMIDAVHYNLFEGGCLPCGSIVGFGVGAVTEAEGCPYQGIGANVVT